VLDFYKECREREITRSSAQRPTWRPNRATSARSAEAGSTTPRRRRAGREALLPPDRACRDHPGDRNLINSPRPPISRATTTSPVWDWELLASYHDGLIATTGCARRRRGPRLSWPTISTVPSGWRGACRTSSARTSLFVELQDHGIAAQKMTNPGFIRIAKSIGAPLVATNDSHYCKREDSSP